MKKFVPAGPMFLIYFIFSWASITGAQEGLTNGQICGIEKSITEVMADCQIPGVAIAIIKDANVAYGNLKMDTLKARFPAIDLD